MEYETFHLKRMPTLSAPVFIIGFRGWGNALDVSAGMAAYLVETLRGVPVGHIDSDRCYRYDERRPVVTIEAGEMTSIDAPGGQFFTVETDSGENDLVVLLADEPNLIWHRFSLELVDLAQRLDAPAVITLGSMFDTVLHTDRIISAVTAGGSFEAIMARHKVTPIDYHGPSAIHTIILEACRRREIAGASLWCHCPAYLQGITHHGAMRQLAALLCDMASFSLPIEDLDARWEVLEVQIGRLITENPKLEDMMAQIRRKNREGALQNKPSGSQAGNVINLRDFIDP